MDTERANLGTERALRVLRRRAPWILACVVLVAGGAYGAAKGETPKYTATASLAFNDSPLAQQIAGLSSSNDLGLLAQQNSNVELVRSSNTAAKTAKVLGHGLTDEEVIESLGVSGKGESSIVSVSASNTSPTLAAAIANTYSSQFVKEQHVTNHEFFESALKVVRRQLSQLPPAQRFGTDGLDLQDRAHTLALLAELEYNNVQLAAEALVPSSPSSPRTKRDTILGAALGLLLGLGVAFLLERFDRRIREPSELEVIYGLPLLGSVPKSSAVGGKQAPLPPTEAEAFSLILAHLRFFNVSREVRVLVVASPAPGDGKTTIAHHLAEAAARSGSRVLLVEVDLRVPTLSRELGIPSGPGLTDVLMGAVSADEAIQSVPLRGSPGEGAADRRLDVLLAGAVLPPNPGELLESQAMDAVLTRARSAYDLVVIDTPPLTAVSDAFSLLTKVDGVIIVGWVGRSRRDSAEQLQHVLVGSGAPLLGIVANGSRPNGLGSYANPGGSATSAPAVVALADGVAVSEQFVSTSSD
jgi:succinoglycan biosynthesis transport protein ExoP